MHEDSVCSMWPQTKLVPSLKGGRPLYCTVARFFHMTGIYLVSSKTPKVALMLNLQAKIAFVLLYLLFVYMHNIAF